MSDDRYVPARSDYEPRAGRRINYPIHDTFTHRVYYLEYTLDSCIADGENTVEVILGNGWYNQHEKIAAILGEGSVWIDSEFSVCTVALKREFYNEFENSYCGGVQGTDAFALDLGIGNRISFEGGKLTAKPHLPKNLGYAKGFLETRFGRINFLYEFIILKFGYVTVIFFKPGKPVFAVCFIKQRHKFVMAFTGVRISYKKRLLALR